MTSRERVLAVLHGDMPDCMPCCPDISNMVPCRLTGKPFWDIYAYQDPPLWKAHITALKYFDFDGGFEIYNFGSVDPVTGEASPLEERVVHRYDDGRFAHELLVLACGDEPGPGLAIFDHDEGPGLSVFP